MVWTAVVSDNGAMIDNSYKAADRNLLRAVWRADFPDGNGRLRLRWVKS